MTNNIPSERITLDINVTAPSFHLKDAFGRMINLKDYKGKKSLLAFSDMPDVHFVI